MLINKSQIKVVSYTLFAIAGVLIADMLRSLLIYEEYTPYGTREVLTRRAYEPLLGNEFIEKGMIVLLKFNYLLLKQRRV